MYAVVRRYEGVTDPAEAGRRVEEDSYLSFAKCLDSWPTTGLTRGWSDALYQRL